MARKEGLIGRKVGMTQVFADDGSHVPVTVIEAGPCTIIGIKTAESHGYDALQIGFGAKKKNVSKPRRACSRRRTSRRCRSCARSRLEKTEKLQGYQLGQALTVEMFAPGELVDVVGVTKGKGFQGGVKRYGWYGGDATHGYDVPSCSRLDRRLVGSLARVAGVIISPGAWAVTADRAELAPWCA